MGNIWRAITNAARNYSARNNSNNKQKEVEETAIVRWTKWTALGTWGAVVVAAGAAGLLIVQLEDSRQATIDANRAWLAVDFMRFNFVAPFALFNPHIKNVGHAPATEVILPDPPVR